MSTPWIIDVPKILNISDRKVTFKYRRHVLIRFLSVSDDVYFMASDMIHWLLYRWDFGCKLFFKF